MYDFFCFAKTRKQWFDHMIETPTASTLSLNFYISSIFVCTLTTLSTSKIHKSNKKCFRINEGKKLMISHRI